MKKSWFLSFLIISLSLTAFLAGYIMVKRGVDSTLNSKTGTILDKFSGDQQSTADSQQSPTDQNQPVSLTEKRVLSAVNSYNRGEILYFEKGTGKLLSLNLENKSEQPVLDKALLNFVSAIWSPTKKEFIGAFVSGQELTFKYFNIDTGKEVPLDSNIRSVAFSPDGSLIIYHFLEQTIEQSPVGKLFISGPDGKYQKKILDTRLKNIRMTWPTQDKMAFVTSDSEMFLVTEGGKLTKILDLKPGLEEIWSPSGKKLLFSVSSMNPETPENTLSIKNIESQEERELESTSASKCVWSIDDINVFCAIQKSPSVDTIFRINTSDGTQKIVAEPLVQIREMLLTSTEDNLLFINASDEGLYSIKISD